MFTNLIELIKSMPDEQKCREYIAEQRWGKDRVVCPYCSHEKAYVVEGGRRYKCAGRGCYRKFSVTVGTIMENSNIPLVKWLTAIYLVSAHKKGISSYQLAKDIGITQKHSWFMLHRIREMFRVKVDTKLDNVVEIDEVYIGGKVPNMSKSKRKKLREEGNTYNTKTMVVGMLERGGKLRLMPVKQNALEIQNFVRDNVDTTANLITDQNGAYTALGKDYASHEVVNHSGQEYVREGNIHTNGIEGAFSLLKRSIIGIYHQASPKHLARYCDETMYRYNLRHMTDADRFALSIANIEGRLTYKDLKNTPVPEKPKYNPLAPTGEGGTQGKKRAIYQLFDGEIVNRFESTKEASEFTGIKCQNISRVLRGIKTTTGGYQWVYA